MRGRTAWTLAALTLVLAVADLVVTSAYQSLLSEDSVARHGFPFLSLAVTGSALLGAVIVSRYERHPVGVILVLVGVTSAFSLVMEAYSIWVVREDGPGSRSLGGVAGWVSSLLGGQLAIAGLALMFLLAPDGHLLSRRWRPAAWCIAAGALVCSAAVASIDPTGFDLEATDVGPVRGPMFTIGFLLISVGLLAAVVSMVVRLRRSSGDERRQVRLIALGVALLALAIANLFVVQELNGGQQTLASSVPLFVAYTMLPAFFAVAVLRYRLYGVEVIVNWTFVLACGAAFAAVGYTTLVVAVGRLVDSRTSGFWLSLFATAMVALAFQPLRRAVVRAANRLAYGSRAQPYEALSDFSRRLAATPSPETLLRAVAEAAGRAVAARHASASLHGSGDGTVSASWGQDLSDGMTSHAVPVRSGGQVLGSIVVGVDKHRPWHASDERLLAALADQAAVAFRNTAMEASLAEQVAELDRTTRQLCESRARIIEAEDAARRTLENAVSRDVLPHLVSLPEQVHRARRAVTQQLPDNGVEALVTGTNAALESLRELTRGIFPTQLARAGLEPALRSLATRRTPAVALDVDPAVAGQRFSARVEAAVYFCCAEAARTGTSSIALSLAEQALVLDIGYDAGSAVDLRLLVDRVEAAGGSLVADGQVLRCVIPVGGDEPGTDLRVPSAVPVGGGGPGG